VFKALLVGAVLIQDRLEVPIRDHKIGVCCAIIATQIDSYFFNHLNAEQ
jgi:hypothetical protein